MVMVVNKERTVSTNEAARLLGMSRPSFYAFAEKHEIEPTNPPNKNLQRTARLLWRFIDIEPYILPEFQEESQE